MNGEELRKIREKVNSREYKYDYDYKESNLEIQLGIVEQLDIMNEQLKTLIEILKEKL